MLSKGGLQLRVKNLQESLKLSELKFSDARELLKSLKKDITDTKGAILEVEKLLLQAV